MSFAPESASDKRPWETKESDVEILDPAVPVPIIEPRGDAAFKPPQPVAPLQANTTENTPAPASNQTPRNVSTHRLTRPPVPGSSRGGLTAALLATATATPSISPQTVRDSHQKCSRYGCLIS